MPRPEIIRKQRVNEIKEEIMNLAFNGNNADEYQLISYFCNSWGATERKLKEYIKEIEGTGFIKRKYGLIIVNDNFLKEEIAKVNKELNENTENENSD